MYRVSREMKRTKKRKRERESDGLERKEERGRECNRHRQ